MNPLITIDAVKIIEEIGTEGSAPLRVLCNDDNTYIAKSTLQRTPPIELINEIICAYFCISWGLKVPPFVLIKISDEVLLDFTQAGNSLSDHYRVGFNELPLFGSRELNPIVELELFFDIKSKKDLKHFVTPKDLLKIGALDLWIGNMDRKPNNLNILISSQEEGFEFHPIDHAAAFGYLTNYREVKPIMLRIDPKNSILSSDSVKKIRTLMSSEDEMTLKNDIIASIESTCQQLDFIFDQVPKDWGFSRKAKDHLKKILADEKRNQQTIHTFLSY